MSSQYKYYPSRLKNVTRTRNQRRTIAASVLPSECEMCGEKKKILFYANRDPRKRSELSRKMTCSLEKFEAELANTIVVCQSCNYARKKAVGIAIKRPITAHGTRHSVLVRHCKCKICTDPEVIEQIRLAFNDRQRKRRKNLAARKKSLQGSVV